MRPKGLEGGEIMYWDKEYSTGDRDVRHLLTEEGVVIGAFVGIIALLFIVSLIF
jgi:hypothetical protein